MTNLYESELINILPDYIKQDYSAKAFCYAVDKQLKKLLDYTENIRIWYNLTNAYEGILDTLAAELRTQYYAGDLDINIKRKLIANTIMWYQKAGTVAAVEELIRTVFDSGTAQEWYTYGGQPHHFKVKTSNPNITTDDLQKFNEIIKNVKRKTAVLDSVEIILEATMNTYYGFKLEVVSYISMKQKG